MVVFGQGLIGKFPRREHEKITANSKTHKQVGNDSRRQQNPSCETTF